MRWISEAQIAETTYTSFTDSLYTLVQAEAQHRQHTIIEYVNADLIAGPLAHLPSGQFSANDAWLTCAGIAHNLTRAAGHLAARTWTTARPATIRTWIITVAARIAHRARAIHLHLPEYWPWQTAFDNLFTAVHPHPADHPPADTRRPDHRPRTPSQPPTTHPGAS